MNKINFTNEQIEYIKNASDHVEMLCGGRGQGKTHQLINEMQNEINNLQSKIDKVNKILNANTHVENIYHALCNLFDEEYQYEIDNEELNDILKEVE